MKKFLIPILFILAAFNVNAQLSLSSLNYSQNFNTLDTLITSPPTTSTNLPTGWVIAEIGTNGNNSYVPGTGSSNAGNTYSFGSIGSTERALGSVGSASNRSNYGIWITNNNANAITSINVSFTMEQWRCGDTASIKDTSIFSYSTNATSINDTLASWLNAGSLSLVSSNPNAGANLALDGNLAINKSTMNGILYVTVPVGGSLWLRWTDQNIVGSDDGLSVDDFSIVCDTIPQVKPVIVWTSPLDNANNVPLGPTDLKVAFDKAITLGTGNVSVANLTAGSSVVVSASSCLVNGDTVTIPGINILPSASYAVIFDSTCFKYLTNNSFGIYDSATWNFNSLNPYPVVSFYQPFDNSTNVSINPQVGMRFNKPISAGTGNVVLKNITDGTQVIYSLPSANVTIQTDSVLINVGTLLFSKLYAIRYDSTCFTNNGYKAAGIYNDTTWNFTTESTPPPPATSLNESFVNCAFPVLGTFKDFSVSGLSRWRCSNFGRTDTDAVYMNGAIATQTFDNEDWLISGGLNMSSYNQPYLNFWTKVRFTGSNTKDLMLSSNYISGNPTAATWTNLNPNFAGLDSTWKLYKNIDLTLYKATPFNIAFKYVSFANTSAADAEEWTIDDVLITEGPLSVKNTINNTDIFIVQNNSTKLDLVFNAAETGNYSINILDMNGKIIKQQIFNVNAGRSVQQLELGAIATGLYIAEVSNGSQSLRIKFTK